MSDKATFHGKFRGASVTLGVDYDAWRETQDISKAISQKWSGSPSAEMVPDYVAWMHTVMCEVAQRINEPIFYGYPAGDLGDAKYFIYRPDGTYAEDDPLEET